MVLAGIIQYHDDFMEKHGDPRVKNLPLMSGPLPTTAICIAYVLLVKYVGPKLMENRKPFKLKKVLLVYNIVQVIWSAYAVYVGLRCGLMTTVSLTCFPVDYSDSEIGRTGVRMAYLYYASKFVEMLDTVFFIMRKKMNQVSTLHVIHHGILPFSCWWGLKFFPGGQAAYWAFWNCFIHTIMYTYYLLAAFGPRIQKYLWWKKYLTILQLTQFVAIWIHATQVLFNGCNYNKIYSAYVSGHGVLFFYMFYQFYRNEYNKGGNKAKEALPKAMNICSPSASNGGNYYAESSEKQK